MILLTFKLYLSPTPPPLCCQFSYYYLSGHFCSSSSSSSSVFPCSTVNKREKKKKKETSIYLSYPFLKAESTFFVSVDWRLPIVCYTALVSLSLDIFSLLLSIPIFFCHSRDLSRLFSLSRQK